MTKDPMKAIKILENNFRKRETIYKIIEMVIEMEQKDDNKIALKSLMSTFLVMIHDDTGKSIKEIADEIREETERHLKVLKIIEDGGAEKNEKNEEDHIGTITLRIDVDSTGGSGK